MLHLDGAFFFQEFKGDVQVRFCRLYDVHMWGWRFKRAFFSREKWQHFLSFSWRRICDQNSKNNQAQGLNLRKNVALWNYDSIFIFVNKPSQLKHLRETSVSRAYFNYTSLPIPCLTWFSLILTWICLPSIFFGRESMERKYHKLYGPLFSKVWA